MPQLSSEDPAPSPWAWLWTTPWLLGAALTVGFYCAVPHLPDAGQAMARRYFCNHPTEYCEATLFFIGIADLLLKALRLRRERSALKALPAASLTTEPPQEERAGRILEFSHSLPRLASSLWAKRLRSLGAEASARGSGADLEERLKDLAGEADDDLHDSYSLLGTVTWAIPIMGFLGTVLGITIAIAYITPDQLDKSLNEVTGGLAVAFDTTAVALVLSLVLVFGQWGVKSRESDHLKAIAGAARRVCAAQYPPSDTENPWQLAQGQAASALIDRTEELVGRQTNLWSDAIDRLRTKWSETIDAHRSQLSTSLSSGADEAWTDHREQLASLRNEFVGSYRDVSRQLSEAIAESNGERLRGEQLLREQTQGFWDSFRAEWASSQATQEARATSLAIGIETRIREWQDQMSQLADAAQGQMAQLREQTGVLLRIVEQEEQLAGLERRLTDNLEAVRAAETFEHTLHSLTAAVHMLTVRHSSRAA